jgi:hypothetical protein
MRHSYSLEKAYNATRTKISEEDTAKIRDDYFQKGLSMRRISKSYGYREWVVERVLGKRYGKKK